MSLGVHGRNVRRRHKKKRKAYQDAERREREHQERERRRHEFKALKESESMGISYHEEIKALKKALKPVKPPKPNMITVCAEPIKASDSVSPRNWDNRPGILEKFAEERRRIARPSKRAPFFRTPYASQPSEEERLKLEARRRVIDQKIQQGISRVERRHVVTVLDIESNGKLRFYFVQSEYYDRGKKPAGLDEDTIPKLRKNIEVLRSCSPFGKAIAGLFVGEEFIFKGIEDDISYRIINVEPLKESDFSKAKSSITVNNKGKRRIYAGRGQKESGENNTLDGSKNIGYLARDGEQYGSFPSHDDYSEESNAEGSDYNDFADESDD